MNLKRREFKCWLSFNEINITRIRMIEWYKESMGLETAKKRLQVLVKFYFIRFWNEWYNESMGLEATEKICSSLA